MRANANFSLCNENIYNYRPENWLLVENQKGFPVVSLAFHYNGSDMLGFGFLSVRCRRIDAGGVDLKDNTKKILEINRFLFFVSGII